MRAIPFTLQRPTVIAFLSPDHVGKQGEWITSATTTATTGIAATHDPSIGPLRIMTGVVMVHH